MDDKENSISDQESSILNTEILDELSVGLSIFQAGKLIYTNNRFSDILGFTNGEMNSPVDIASILDEQRTGFTRRKFKKRIRKENFIGRGKLFFFTKSKGTQVVAYISKRIQLENKPATLLELRELNPREIELISRQTSGGMEFKPGNIVKINEDGILTQFNQDDIHAIVGRNKWERKSRQMEEKYKILFEYSNDAVVVFDFSGKIIDANKKFVELLGYPREDLLKINMSEFNQNFSSEKISSMRERMMELSGMRLESVLQVNGGHSRNVVICLKVLEGLGQIQAIFKDITARNKTLDELQESQELLTNVIESMSDGLVVLDTNFHFKFWNRAMEKLTGVPAEKLVDSDKKATDFFKHLIRFGAIDHLRDALHGKITRVDETPFVTKDAKEGFTSEIYLPLTDKNGFISGIICVIRDITEKKVMLDKIRENEEMFKGIFENAMDGILIIDNKTNQIVNCNKILVDNLKYSLEELREIRLDDIHPVKPPIVKNEQAPLNESQLKDIHTIDIPMRRKDGSVFYTNISRARVFVDENEYLFEIIHDITTRKQIEEKLKESIKEKEILLREIHHRVKNNLQIISGITVLQSQYMENDTYKKILEAYLLRIKAMANIHEILYKSTSISQMNLSKYIERLVHNLKLTYPTDLRKVEIILNVECIQIDLDKAIHYGLILNEFIMNAFTHAFADGRTGKINIKIQQTSNDLIRMVIENDGIKLPDDFRIEDQETMGFQIITTVIQQLKGKLSFERMQGTRWVIECPV